MSTLFITEVRAKQAADLYKYKRSRLDGSNVVCLVKRGTERDPDTLELDRGWCVEAWVNSHHVGRI